MAMPIILVKECKLTLLTQCKSLAHLCYLDCSAGCLEKHFNFYLQAASHTSLIQQWSVMPSPAIRGQWARSGDVLKLC